MKNKLNDKEWMVEQYVTNRRSSVDIAKELGCNYNTVCVRLNRYGVRMRTNSESKLSGCIKFLEDKEWMIDQYITQGLSMFNIATKIGCTDVTVNNYLKSHGIKIKTWSEALIGKSKYTLDALQNAALKYQTRKEFSVGNYSEYQAARAQGLLDTICFHMTRGAYGYDTNKSGILYYIKFENSETVLYKIGITNLSAKNRISSMCVDKKYKIIILKEFLFENGKCASEIEKVILKKFKEYRYIGDDIMVSGNTELFTKDVLGLDVL